MGVCLFVSGWCRGALLRQDAQWTMKSRYKHSEPCWIMPSLHLSYHNVPYCLLKNRPLGALSIRSDLHKHVAVALPLLCEILLNRFCYVHEI